MGRAARSGRKPAQRAGKGVYPGASSGSWGFVNDERRCLIIDGQPTTRLGVRGLLADRYEVEEAENGRGALELLTVLGDFDVAIVELPEGPEAVDRGLTGIRAIRALRKARPGLGIVAHATHPERRVVTEAMHAGATAFVAKNSPCASLIWR